MELTIVGACALAYVAGLMTIPVLLTAFLLFTEEAPHEEPGQ